MDHCGGTSDRGIHGRAGGRGVCGADITVEQLQRFCSPGCMADTLGGIKIDVKTFAPPTMPELIDMHHIADQFCTCPHRFIS
uniref:Uncharacterized protein n=1 Tax=Candidatus Methanogaster sp. ANME-2c ERB4 TaxID=2759911 RepID=A0A7G9YIL7_9EURY|nr:hypothetical protein LHEHDPNP_00002 [Methanosarcinales archaeon ANME-2c ERB4]QNO47851.1 hypothetical protein DJFEGNLO_00005 [Methanosarcinales archaeon ANME-2c ERB4]